MTQTAKLVASAMARSNKGLAGQVKFGTVGADLVELRVDALDKPDLEMLRASTVTPSILTCRAAEEGGHFHGDETARIATLTRAVELDFDYVDFEIATMRKIRRVAQTGAQLVLSYHDFEGMPKDVEALTKEALDLGADVVKVAARVDSLRDVLRLASLGTRVRDAGKTFVPVPLGPHGTSGRILAGKLGAAWTYAPARGGDATGPGQIGLDEALELYRVQSVHAGTEVYGIVGIHALSSRSPRMHNWLFVRLERDAVYVPFQEGDLGAFVAAARELGVSGLSVTNPFKEAILPFLDEVDEAARRIGAVNTIVVRDGHLCGYNTDREGVLEPLRAAGNLRGKKAVVVGAGGAARAAVAALSDLGASVRVLARRPERARKLAEPLGVEAGSLVGPIDEAWDVLVNATPIGSLGSSEQEFPLGEVPEHAVVFDMVTVPEETPLIRRAREAGARTITGLAMLSAQARHQARLWTGVLPGADEMERAARREAGLGRYSRQMLFTEIGEEGQRRIRSKRVLVVGMGALGSVSAEMLVRAGVQGLRIVDRDYVDESNLQRQSLYDEEDWQTGLPKAIAAARKLTRINGDVHVEPHVEDLHAGNVRRLFEGIDLVLDGTDNFETRYLLNDASVETGVPWIYAACVGSYGMSFVVIPGTTPCLRCLMEEEPAPGTSPTCDTAGVISPAVHAVASFQVTEALKLLSGREDALHGSIMSLDVWHGRVDRFKPSSPRAECPACERRSLDYLAGTSESQALTLCGRNAVQIRPAKPADLELKGVATRLSELGEVTVNAYLLRAKLDGCEIVLFKDGRAIVHGTEELSEAKSLYARYVGS